DRFTRRRCSPAFTKWTVKKSRLIDWQHGVIVVATGIVRWRRVTLWFAAAIPLLAVFAWVDPARSIRSEEDARRFRTARASDEARLAEEAKTVPATGELALDFHRLDFRLPPEAY